MDFRDAAQMLSTGDISREELIEQILSLPCIYSIFQDKETLHSIGVINDTDGSEIKIPLFFSNLDIAVEAIRTYQTPDHWYVGQWTDIKSALEKCLSTQINGLAFDSMPEGNRLNGLVIDRDSINELISLAGE